MILGANSYPFLEVFWTILIFFGFVFWLMILFNVIGDIFRRHDISGWGKVLWLIAIILVPYFGVFIYLIVEHEGLAQRHRLIAPAHPGPVEPAVYFQVVSHVG